MVPMPMPFPWMPQTLNAALSEPVPANETGNTPKVLDHLLCKGCQPGVYTKFKDRLNGPGTVEYEKPHRSSESFRKEFVFEAR